MKNSLFTTVLMWLLATSAILSIVFCLQFIFRTRELFTRQAEMGRYQNNHQLLNVLIGDLREYSKRNPAINPILQPLGPGRTNAPAAEAPKPSGK